MRIWDRGTYELLKWEPRKVEVALHGERLNGRYALFPTGRDEPGKDWMIHRMDPPDDPGREPMPERLVPMLAQPGELPADDDGLGVRDQVGRRARHRLLGAGAAALREPQPQRHHAALSRAAQAQPRAELAQRGPRRRGRRLRRRRPAELRRAAAAHAPRLARRRSRRLAKEAPVTYVIFDLLWLDGHSLMDLPYAERRARLEELELTATRWRTPEHVVGQGEALLAATREQGLEGVVAKRLDCAVRARAAQPLAG